MKPVAYIVHQIRTMCEAFPGRTGGSQAERACQAYMAEELSRYADKVVTQDFTAHPDAGWGWIVIAAGFGILSVTVPLLGMQSLACAALGFAASLIAMAVTIVQFFFGKPVIDRLFQAKEARNVMATARPAGAVRRRIVLCGHADAAYEMTYSHLGGAKCVLGVAASALIGLVATFVLTAVLLMRRPLAGPMSIVGVWRWLRLAPLLFLPAFIAALFFFNLRRVVDGANDNLSGCAVAMATLRALSRPEARLQSTEVCCLLTSSEECGLQGARAFGKAYAEADDGIDTAFIVLDTLHDPSQLMVYTQGAQPDGQAASRLVQETAEALGLALPVAPPFLGATDADALARAGLNACAVCGVDHTPQPYYHTRADTADNIDERCLAISLRLCLAVARRVDRQAAQPLEEAV